MSSPTYNSPAASIESTDLYQQAVAIVQQHHRVSVSLLQRRLKLGYSQALNLMDTIMHDGEGKEQNWKLSPWMSNLGGVPRIVVIGVGGGGNNTVNYMVEHSVAGVEFVNVNTDSLGLNRSLAPKNIKLGHSGLGANGKSELARLAAIQSEYPLRCAMEGACMVIVTAGLGGGTGTGASPEIVRIAKNLGLLTVGVVSLPFEFEGIKRMERAIAGLVELQAHVDALICFSNEKLLQKYEETNTTVDDAYSFLFVPIKNVISGLVALVHESV